MKIANKTIDKDLTVAGIKCRTCNMEGRAENDLKLLWDKFFGEQVMQNLPQRNNDNIMALYTEYEYGYEGDYTAFLGFEIDKDNNLENLPGGVSLITVPAGRYKVYDVEEPTPEKVVGTWERIWNADSELNRNYICDFEIYEDNGKGVPKSVAVYIGVK